jgi:hypothetical protein
MTDEYYGTPDLFWTARQLFNTKGNTNRNSSMAVFMHFASFHVPRKNKINYDGFFCVFSLCSRRMWNTCMCNVFIMNFRKILGNKSLFFFLTGASWYSGRRTWFVLRSGVSWFPFHIMSLNPSDSAFEWTTAAFQGCGHLKVGVQSGPEILLSDFINFLAKSVHQDSRYDAFCVGVVNQHGHKKQHLVQMQPMFC